MGKRQNRTDSLVARRPLALFRRVGGFSFGKQRLFGRRQVKSRISIQQNLRKKNEQKKIILLARFAFFADEFFRVIASPLFYDLKLFAVFAALSRLAGRLVCSLLSGLVHGFLFGHYGLPP